MMSSSTIFDESIRISCSFLFIRSARTRFLKMHSSARSFDIDDRFCNVVQVEPPRNTAEVSSIIVSTAHTTVETTVASEKNSAQKPKRLRWMNVLGVRCSVSTNGTVTKSYAFLTDQSNWMDIMFVRHLLVDKPF
jgi:hypothetical protein